MKKIINLSVEIPESTVKVCEYRIECGNSRVEIVISPYGDGDLWIPYNDWRRGEDSQKPLPFDDMVRVAKERVQEQETNRLMHLQLGSELGEI